MEQRLRHHSLYVRKFVTFPLKFGSTMSWSTRTKRAWIGYQQKLKKMKNNRVKVKRKEVLKKRMAFRSTRGCAVLPRVSSFVVLSARHGEDVIPAHSRATSPHCMCIQSVLSALNCKEERRLSLVAGGQSGGASRETEMKLLRVFVTLACFFFNAAKSGCNGKLCRTALIGPVAFHAGRHRFSLAVR